jgi:site-specific DNA-methyltransferase (adenine-specific)
MGKEWDRIGDVKRARCGETSGLPTGPGSGRGTSPTAGRPGFDLSLSSQRSMQEWHERWAIEALRLLKPGGHLLAFGGTRTFHRLTCALEDAGFEIRDCLCWLYGQGFPKSLNVAVTIDKAEGHRPRGRTIPVASRHLPHSRYAKEKLTANRIGQYRARTRSAEPWQGWGTALKPAWEPVIVARKPLAGTVAQNVLAHGTGALNIDGCRIAFRSHADESHTKTKNRHGDFHSKARRNLVYGTDERPRSDDGNYDASGRWPANVTLSHTADCRQAGQRRLRTNGHHPTARGTSGLGTAGHKGQDGLAERRSAHEPVGCWECSADCAVRLLEDHSGAVGNAWRRDYGERYAQEGRRYRDDCFDGGGYTHGSAYADGSGASRFFYCTKASRAERDAGLHDLEKPLRWSSGERSPGTFQTEGIDRAACNHHPTVKPLGLMRWLVRLVTPPGGIVLDPFAGSGSTGIAAIMEGARFLGIEREAEYIPITRARIKHGARTTERRRA